MWFLEDKGINRKMGPNYEYVDRCCILLCGPGILVIWSLKLLFHGLVGLRSISVQLQHQNVVYGSTTSSIEYFVFISPILNWIKAQIEGGILRGVVDALLKKKSEWFFVIKMIRKVPYIGTLGFVLIEVKVMVISVVIFLVFGL